MVENGRPPKMISNAFPARCITPTECENRLWVAPRKEYCAKPNCRMRSDAEQMDDPTPVSHEYQMGWMYVLDLYFKKYYHLGVHKSSIICRKYNKADVHFPCWHEDVENLVTSKSMRMKCRLYYFPNRSMRYPCVPAEQILDVAIQC